MDSDVRKRKMQLVESDAGGQPPVKMSRAIYPEQPQRKPMTASDEMTPAAPVVASAHQQQQQQPVDAKQAAYAANEPPQQQQQQLSADPFAGLANAAALNQLIQRTGYSITQENGQRKYGGPPPGWNGRPVPRGAEVFVGKIPRDVFEDELVPVFERAGTIYELRLMMDFDGKNRGYAFVMFGSKQEAKLAVRRLNNYEIRKGRMLGVCYSVDNCRLFVGGIPKTKKKDDIAAEMRKVTDGVCDVIVYPSASDKTKNRGFAFVEYESHRAAAMARRKLIPGRIQLWGHPIAVDWAEPEQEVDDDVMEQVKVLYVRNLMLDTSEDTLQAVFGRFGAVERVKKIRDYAFVHFNARDACLRAMRDVNGTRIDGAEVEVTLAKPVDKNDHNRMAKVGAKVLDGAGAAPAHLVAANPLQTAAVTPNGQMIVYPAGMYGSGEIAYYQPQHLNLTPPAAAPAGAIRNHDRARGAARNSYLGYSAGKATYGRYYAKNNQERTMVVDAAGLDMLQQQQLLNGQLASIGEQLMYKPNAGLSALAAASAAAGQQHQAYAAAPQLVAPRAPDLVLDEVCSRNMWGTPTYQLMTTPGPDQRQLFLYKVSVPAFASLYPHQPYFQPDKLCVTVDEARTYAAEYVLAQVGLQADGSSSQQQQQQQATVIPMTTLLQPQHQQVAYQLAPQPALQLSASPTGAPPTFVPVTTPSPTAAFPMSFVDPAHMMSHTMQPITVMYQ